MEKSVYAARWHRIGSMSADRMAEVIFLSLFGGLVFYLNCYTIMLEHYPPHSVELALRCGLILTAFQKLHSLGHRGEGRKLILPGIVCLAMLASYWSTGYEFLIELALCVLCAIDVPYRRILRVYIAVAGVCFAVGVMGGFMDLCTQYSYSSGRNGVMWRHSFGVVYPTDFAAHIVYILLALWACEERPHFSRMLVLCMTAIALQLKLTDTRCSEIVCGLLALCVLYTALADWLTDKKWMRAIESFLSWGMTIAMPVLATLAIAATALYVPGESFWDKLNALTSNRLKYGQEAFANYGVTLFGTAFDMFGNGGLLEKPKGYTYNFLDSSYVLLAVRYGMVVLLAVLLIYVLVLRKAALYGNRRLSQSFFLVAVACLIEHHLPELAYDPFILLAFSNFQPEHENPKSPSPIRERKAEDWVCFLLAIMLAIFLPWLWSYGKTAVHVLILKEADSRTVPAQIALFILISASCVLLWGIYRLLVCALTRQRLKKEILYALAAFLLVSGVLVFTEYRLGKNTYRYTERLEKCEDLVEAIRDADLSCSIRVADIPELYRREMDGTENQLLATYTASTDTDVVIFSDSAVEHENYLLSAGYTCYQVTEKCIAYTNCADAAAILLENGCSLLQ